MDEKDLTQKELKLIEIVKDHEVILDFVNAYALGNFKVLKILIPSLLVIKTIRLVKK